MSDQNNASDAELLARYLARSTSDDEREALFRCLVERHTALVHSICLRDLSGDHALAADATQAVFILLHKKAASIRRKESLASWLFGAARRVTAHIKRDAGRRRKRETEASEMLQNERDSANQPAASAQVLARLNDAVARLAPKLRSVILMHFFQGRSQREIAEEIGCSEAAVNKRMQRGREKIRSHFAANGIVPLVGIGALLASASAKAAPAGLTAKTIAAVCQQAAPAASASASLAIAQGVLHAMYLTKLKIAALVAVVTVLLSGAAVGTGLMIAGPESNVGEPDGVAVANDKEDNRIAEKKVRITSATISYTGLGLTEYPVAADKFKPIRDNVLETAFFGKLIEQAKNSGRWYPQKVDSMPTYLLTVEYSDNTSVAVGLWSTYCHISYDGKKGSAAAWQDKKAISDGYKFLAALYAEAKKAKGKAGADKWKKKWDTFKEEHVQRELDNDTKSPRAGSPGYEFHVKWKEAKGECVKKFFPDCEIFSQEGKILDVPSGGWSTCASGTNVFVVNKKSGQITCVGNSWPLRKKYKCNYIVLKTYNEMIKELKPEVKGDASAIEMVRLYLTVIGHADDKSWEQLLQNWKYDAVRRGNQWTVLRRWAGDPATSIMMPPQWTIKVNDKGEFKEMKCSYGMSH